MSTTVSYKGNTIATLNNQTKTLTTAGTWVEGNIIITDTTPSYAVTQDENGYIILPSTGTGGNNTVSATQHTIHLEFTDSTFENINVYYDNSLIESIITSYTPSTYNNKTVNFASLDNITWYNTSTIPIGVELIDFNKTTKDYVIDSDGIRAEQWYAVSDYTPIQPGMTFSYTGCYWFYIGFYDSNKTFINTLHMYSDGTQRQDDTNSCDGTLSGNEIPSNAAYIRITGGYNPSSNNMSLIRTA